MSKIIDSSSDEDDPYTNSVARLRALKKCRLESVELSLENSIKQQTNSECMNGEDTNSNDKDVKGKEINKEIINIEDIYDDEIRGNGIQMRNKMVRRNRRIITRTVCRRTRGRPLPIDVEYDVEIVREEKEPESCKDIIALSDDDAYIEDDNYEITIKVYWRSNRIDRLSMRRHDNFKGIFEHYADLEGVSVNEILIMKKDKIVNYTDTPASLELSIIDILDGGIVEPGMNISKDKNNDEDICTIKVQTANKKQSLIIPLKKDEPFKTLFANCAEQLNVKENNLKLYFDGEQIVPSDTPESLDLEAEACIDLHIST